MINTLITHLQVFGIGFSFGIVGPCFLVCTPILLTYIVGRQERWTDAFIEINLFLFGRLFAYVVLGGLAGFGGYYLRRATESGLVSYMHLASGVISILLGIFVLFHKEAPSCAHKRSHNNIYDFGSILALGFVIGISPCVPLTMLLLEIALISKNALDGAVYALSFGLGTFAAGLIVVGALAGILKGFAQKMIHSKSANILFRSLCALLLVLFGLNLISGSLKL